MYTFYAKKIPKNFCTSDFCFVFSCKLYFCIFAKFTLNFMVHSTFSTDTT